MIAATAPRGAAFEDGLAETLRFLESDAALEALAADPYWPKWDGPWWRLTLLFELGLAREAPARAVRALLAAVDTHYLRTFPFVEAEIPAGKDPIRHIACHCALGTAVLVLDACGRAVERELDWVFPWFVRYQLPDGGLNCDEAAYTRPTPRASIVSTLPPLEALLVLARRRPLTAAEEACLDRGASYLVARKLFRSVSKGGAPMNAAWLEPVFPRFYEYDVLRGLAFLVAWAERRPAERGRSVVAATAEVVAALEARTASPGGLRPGRRAWAGARTRRRDARGDWPDWTAARPFPLLDAVGAPGEPCPWLARSWDDVRGRLARLRSVS